MNIRRSAYTLVEILIVISIISILAAILMPVFSQAREQARQVTCIANTRQLMAGVLLYTQDYDEKLPILGTGVDGRGRWMWQVKTYVRNSQIFTCPHLPRNQYDGTMWTEQSGYGWAEHLWGRNSGTPAADGYNLSEIGRSAETIAIGDTGYDGISGWAMYRRPPWNGESDGRPGFYPQFRHHASHVRDFQDTSLGTGRLMAIDGICDFAFIDGHAKGLHPNIAFRIDPARTVSDPSDGDQYLYWNRN